MLKLRPVSDPEIYKREFEQLASSEIIRSGMSRRAVSRHKISRADAHSRCFIRLNVPCINSVVCGSNYGKGATLLGITGSHLQAIADFKVCWDMELNKEWNIGSGISLTSLTSSDLDNYLFNGMYVEKLIADMDINKIIQDTLRKEVRGAIDESMWGNIEIKRNEGSIPLYGDFFLNISDPEQNARVDANAIYKNIARAVSYGSFRRISMLINIMNEFDWDEDEAKSYIWGVLLLTVLPVPPLLTRPSAGKKKHSLTLAYCKLLEHNSDYNLSKEGELEGYATWYRTLYAYTDTIIRADATEHGLGHNSTFNSVRSILTTMKGKNGFMRSQLTAKRQDYAGRAAVVIDPFMPLNCVGIPKTIIPKNYRLWSYRDEHLNNSDIYNKSADTDYDAQIVKTLKKDGIIDRVPIAIGRNPTLHKHGIQGFHVKVVDGRAFRMSPLVCPAYNMDFDGDTAHEEVPVTEASVEEMNKLFITDRNLILPKTGECTIVPRMDMLYGLFKCSTAQPTGNSASFQSGEDLREAIFSMEVKLGDTVTVPGYGTGIAGKIAFLSCFPKTVVPSLPEFKPITSGTIKAYVNVMLDYEGQVFDHTINCLVELGFRVANLMGESVSMLAKPESRTEAAKAFDEAYDKFHVEMEKIDELNAYGFYDSETYGIEYGTYLDRVNKALKNGVFDKVGDNMFSDMAKSGARGNAGNLVQIFGSKGRIQKSERESFNVVIEHSLQEQLTPMEHRIAAHGARRGQIAKSIRTADTGYFARQLANEGVSLVVTSKDCGTHKGVTVKVEDVRKYFYKEDMSDSEKKDMEEKTKGAFTRLVNGRYTTDNVLVTTKIAESVYEANGELIIRSPITCEDPICQKCYGIDPCTRRPVRVGAAVGIVAAQSLSEPSTQLTMKVFQKGGVQGSSSSAFDRLFAVMSQTDIKTLAGVGRYPTYDPLAWAPGILRAMPYPGGRVMLKIECDNPDLAKKYKYDANRLVSEGVPLKVGKHVEYGETLRSERGDVCTKEMIECFGVERAAYELAKDVYFIFRSDCDLVPVHIETIVSNMMSYIPLYTDVPALRVGLAYTKKQLAVLGADYRNTKFMEGMRGVKRTVSGSVNFLEALVMEDQRSALSNAVLNCTFDMVDNPLIQSALGWYPQIGTQVNPNYLEE